MAPTKAWPGLHTPLGATWDGEGTNFALFAEHAERVELLLFDRRGAPTTVELAEVTDHQWHGYVFGVGPGAQYAYRVDGRYAPDEGLRYNPRKLLLDPYAKAISGGVIWGPEIHGYRWGTSPGRDDSIPSELDSIDQMPRCVVIDPFFPWGEDVRPKTTFAETVIYEVHVKGFTMRHPGVPEPLRGTYAGLAHPASVEHLVSLGVTAVELMPVHHFIDSGRVLDLGLRNYWGYDSIGYFAPEARYSSAGGDGAQVREFKAMVRALHRAGLEVILDVVYNHTGEGDNLGPTLSFRGIDNPAYYRLLDENRRFYFDVTGTGNTLNVRQPQTLRLIMDSLRYWVLEMHVDGFRFDLAAALAREFFAVDRLSAFFDIIHQDPVLSQVKLIAEPWDVGQGGYQVGNFPVRWAEWNGRYRDTVRDYWRDRTAGVSDLAYRLTGSSDLYQDDGRRPWASVNFVTAHDGFTLRDLVSYNQKHNAANGEENRDGSDDNVSWNCGWEGPGADAEVEATRARVQRNHLATLLLSQGIPMLLGGDEMGRTQRGNNNSYCQDNDISWLDWELVRRNASLHRFVTLLTRFRREHPTLRRPGFLELGEEPGVAPHLTFYGPEGRLPALADSEARTLAFRLEGDGVGPDADGRDDDLFVMLNAMWQRVRFAVPRPRGGPWRRVIDTTQPGDAAILEPGSYALVDPPHSFWLGPRGLAVLISSRSQ
jgi:isoamylase